MSNLEIERKFLVSKDVFLNKEAFVRKYRIRQGYLSTNEYGSVRIRIEEDEFGKVAYLMSKIRINEMTNDETPDIISIDHAEVLLSKFCPLIIDKTRTLVIHDVDTWEIDEFHYPNNGLLLAELELSTADEKFSMPPWIIEEVTGRPEYYNANM
jgi:adenylate cyclase